MDYTVNNDTVEKIKDYIVENMPKATIYPEKEPVLIMYILCVFPIQFPLSGSSSTTCSTGILLYIRISTFWPVRAAEIKIELF